MLDIIHDLDIYAHKLLACTAQAVHGACLDEVFYGALIHFLVRHTGNKILQIGIGPPCPALGDHGIDNRPSHTLDGSQRIPDLLPRYRKTDLPFVDIRRQDLDPHIAAGHDIF